MIHAFIIFLKCCFISTHQLYRDLERLRLLELVLTGDLLFIERDLDRDLERDLDLDRDLPLRVPEVFFVFIFPDADRDLDLERLLVRTIIYRFKFSEVFV